MRFALSERGYNYCPNCGSKLVKSGKFKINFCSQCGHKLKNIERISQKNTQCTICHVHIRNRNTRVVNCSFCGSKYHYSCVHDWLARYNACPMCQNVFLNPNLPHTRNRK